MSIKPLTNVSMPYNRLHQHVEEDGKTFEENATKKFQCPITGFINY